MLATLPGRKRSGLLEAGGIDYRTALLLCLKVLQSEWKSVRCYTQQMRASQTTGLRLSTSLEPGFGAGQQTSQCA